MHLRMVWGEGDLSAWFDGIVNNGKVLEIVTTQKEGKLRVCPLHEPAVSLSWISGMSSLWIPG